MESFSNETEKDGNNRYEGHIVCKLTRGVLPCEWINIYPITPPQTGYNTRSIEPEKNRWLEFKVFLLQKAVQVCPTIYRSWRKKRWIHTFPNSINAMWNVSRHDQVSNSASLVNFLRINLLRHERLLTSPPRLERTNSLPQPEFNGWAPQWTNSPNDNCQLLNSL